MKDHEIAKIVNDLRDIAKKYGNQQQLRQRIGRYIVPILKKTKGETTLKDMLPDQVTEEGE